jgi:hypothetical protein
VKYFTQTELTTLFTLHLPDIGINLPQESNNLLMNIKWLNLASSTQKIFSPLKPMHHKAYFMDVRLERKFISDINVRVLDAFKDAHFYDDKQIISP